MEMFGLTLAFNVYLIYVLLLSNLDMVSSFFTTPGSLQQRKAQFISVVYDMVCASQ